ncbi:hypothetical protein MKX08_003816 [Trichoderma sp. CBMAI-0020]|nr:hypothetical protein MKX08_003816 [Trichoderma sp. CBMAI-0020]
MANMLDSIAVTTGQLFEDLQVQFSVCPSPAINSTSLSFFSASSFLPSGDVGAGVPQQKLPLVSANDHLLLWLLPTRS